MKPKSPARSEATRANYTWHLRLADAGKFDLTHWWMDGKEKVSAWAAVYELARRHPLVGEETNKPTLKPNEAPELYLLSKMYGQKSWAKLTEVERMGWLMRVKRIKGVDFRDEMEKCASITQLARQKAFLSEFEWETLEEKLDRAWKARRTDFYAALNEERPIESKLNKASNRIEVRDIIDSELAATKRGFTRNELEGFIRDIAADLHKNGSLIVAIPLDVSPDEAAELVRKLVRREAQFSGVQATRVRWQNWLDVIQGFEDAERLHGGARSQVFARYRRVMDQIRFGSAGCDVMPLA